MKKQNQKKIWIKNRLVLPVFMGILSLLMICSLAAAAVSAPADHDRPDWWDTADARLDLSFPNFNYQDISIPAVADGTKGYTYTTHFNAIGNPAIISSTILNVDLDNEQNFNKIKLFWVGIHFSTSVMGFPDETVVDIIGRYEDGSQTPSLPYDFFAVDDPDGDGTGWAYYSASLFPQPTEETFQILVDSFYMGAPMFEIDMVEIATKCVVPVPSSLLLLGGGICALAGIRRKQ